MIRDSYWLDMPYTPSDPLSGDLDVDVVVIGGGVTGVTGALFLAEGGARVAVLERREIASGATGRNGGFMLAGTHEYYAEAVEELTDLYGPDGRRLAREAWTIALENHDLMAGLMKKYDIQCDYYRHGSFVIAMKRPDRGSHRNPLERIAQSYRLLQEDGFEVAYLDEEELYEIKRSPLLAGAFWNKFDGELHPVKYVRGLAAAAGGLGVRFFENTAVTGVERKDRGLLVHTPGGRIRTQQVLLGMNAYTPQLDARYERRIIPHRGQVFTTEPVSERLFNGVFYANDGWEFWRQLHDGPGEGGRLLFGGGRNHHIRAERGFHFLRRRSRPGQPVRTYRGYKERPTRAVQRTNDRAFNSAFPHLANLGRSHRWGGVMGFSYDSSPFVGETETPGVHIVAGFTGRGNAYATVAARMLSDRLLGRPPTLERRFETVKRVFDPLRGGIDAENRRR
ncbi:MAG: FAD-binding oxidoreductase [Gemmatimonadetes bacterium]|nr:FAD-binding oxidoreductase [Gemmatimonadota bacterium]MYG84518.1 FAD-binding oxidoreductase [Gemmatimonadota bacterium]MYJ91354.1 FAD-binding oxidoreductase [Gemmatimonadota bacterium]